MLLQTGYGLSARVNYSTLASHSLYNVHKNIITGDFGFDITHNESLLNHTLLTYLAQMACFFCMCLAKVIQPQTSY